MPKLSSISKTNLYSLSSKDNFESYSYLDTGNITENKVAQLQTFSDKSNLPSRAKRLVKKDNIIYSSVRPNQKHYGYIDENLQNIIVSTGFVVIDVDEKMADPYYIYLQLIQDDVTHYLQSIAEQSVTSYPSIKASDIEELEINLPPIDVQKRISKIIRSINKKMEINEAINKNLYNQIETLFKLWFQDYSQINNENTKDWREVPLNEIADFINGYSYKGSDLVDKSSVGMATIKNFDRNGGFKLNGYKPIQNIQKIKDNQFIELFDILVAHTDLTQNADVIGNAELVLSKSYFDKIIFSMDLVKVVPKINEISKFLLYSLLRSNSFKQHCLGYVNGTTVLHLSKKALNDYKIFLPIDYSKLKPLEEILETIYNKIAVNISEIEKLEKLRDSLLPKLMNNEIDISKIEL